MRLPIRLAPPALAAAALTLACGGSGSAPAADSARDSVVAAPAATSTTPTLVVGNRYETQGGSVVCPRASALDTLAGLAQRGDEAGFVRALEAAGCSPVVPGAVVHVAEQVGAAARVRRAGDTATYWMFAEKLTPRGP
jgi:hypothetical protein